jgi:hypothetical protein
MVADLKLHKPAVNRLGVLIPSVLNASTVLKVQCCSSLHYNRHSRYLGG